MLGSTSDTAMDASTLGMEEIAKETRVRDGKARASSYNEKEKNKKVSLKFDLSFKMLASTLYFWHLFSY